jgi:hypothetical protein
MRTAEDERVRKAELYDVYPYIGDVCIDFDSDTHRIRIDCEVSTAGVALVVAETTVLAV